MERNNRLGQDSMMENRNTPRGICLKCGAIYHGWALSQAEHQDCSQCNTKLKIEGLRNCDEAPLTIRGNDVYFIEPQMNKVWLIAETKEVKCGGTK